MLYTDILFNFIIPIFHMKSNLSRLTNIPKVTQLPAISGDSNPDLYGFKSYSFFTRLHRQANCYLKYIKI